LSWIQRKDYFAHSLLYGSSLGSTQLNTVHFSGLGQFGAARFGDEPFQQRDVSAMVVANVLCEKNVCF